MTDKDGMIGTSVLPVGRPVIPRLLLVEEDRLVWWFRGADEGDEPPKFAAEKGALDAFIKIRDGEGILRFASRYGVLGLCEHGVPASHSWQLDAQPGMMRHHPGCFPQGFEEGRGWELFDLWLRYARSARSLLSVAIAVHRGKPPDAADWAALFKDSSRPELKDIEYWKSISVSPEERRRTIADRVNWWLALGSVKPSLRWTAAAPGLMFEVGGTFGVLAVQLATTIARAHDIAICTGCGMIYSRSRKAQEGRGNYCQDCKDNGIDGRDRRRRFREGQGKRGP